MIDDYQSSNPFEEKLILDRLRHGLIDSWRRANHIVEISALEMIMRRAGGETRKAKWAGIRKYGHLEFHTLESKVESIISNAYFRRGLLSSVNLSITRKESYPKDLYKRSREAPESQMFIE